MFVEASKIYLQEHMWLFKKSKQESQNGSNNKFQECVTGGKYLYKLRNEKIPTKLDFLQILN